MRKVSQLPPDARPKRQLRRVPVKIGARTLPYLRSILRLGPLQLYRDADGILYWRWGQGPRRRLLRRR